MPRLMGHVEDVHRGVQHIQHAGPADPLRADADPELTYPHARPTDRGPLP